MENISNISKALVKAQGEMSNPKKESNNPFFKSKYADLNSVREAILPVLNENGIAVLQPTVHIEGKNFVKTILLHESGEMLECLTEIVYSKQNDAQSQGSGISYARRYGLQSFVCVGAEDDDGNAATPQNNPNQDGKPKKTEEDYRKEIQVSKDLKTLEKIWFDMPKEFQSKLLAEKNKAKERILKPQTT